MKESELYFSVSSMIKDRFFNVVKLKPLPHFFSWKSSLVKMISFSLFAASKKKKKTKPQNYRWLQRMAHLFDKEKPYVCSYIFNIDLNVYLIIHYFIFMALTTYTYWKILMFYLILRFCVYMIGF